MQLKQLIVKQTFTAFEANGKYKKYTVRILRSQHNSKQFYMIFLVESIFSVGDSIGMGVIIPVSEQTKQEDRFIICFMRLNLNVVVTRVICMPREGLYPLIIFPRGGMLYGQIYTENVASGSIVANIHQVITHPQI